MASSISRPVSADVKSAKPSKNKNLSVNKAIRNTGHDAISIFTIRNLNGIFRGMRNANL